MSILGQILPKTKLIREKNHETYTCFSAVVGGQHIVELMTPLIAPNYYLDLFRLLAIT